MNPGLQLSAVHGHASGVIGRAEKEKVAMFLRWQRSKVIFAQTRQGNNFFLSLDNRSVPVSRVSWVHDPYAIIPCKELQQIHRIAARPLGDKNFFRVDS